MKINAFLPVNESSLYKRLTTCNAQYYTDTSLNFFFILLQTRFRLNERTSEAEKEKKLFQGKCV